MTTPYYPPGAFHFTVKIIGAGMAAAALTGADASFAEVSGMQASWDTEEVIEGGENRFVHRLPTRGKYANLVLKRGVVTTSSFFTEWAGLTIGARLALPVVTQHLLVMLLDQAGAPLVAWAFANAYPVKCEVAALDAMENKVLIETLELSYNYFDRITLGGTAAAAGQLAKLAAHFA